MFLSNLLINISNQLLIEITLSENTSFSLDLELSGEVIPSECSFEILSTKIEIKMKKASPVKWKTLENQGQQPYQWDSVTATPNSSNAQPAPKTFYKKNWDQIGKEEEDDKGGDPLNKLMQQVFGNGTEDQKRAMMKSFVESGGTVLSTNWDEVGKGTVKGSPPKGMEMHDWRDLQK
jgi:suppressor of G2 allele of SKP1